MSIIDQFQLEKLTQSLYSGSGKESIELAENYYQIYKQHQNGYIELFLHFNNSNIQHTLFWTIESLKRLIEETYNYMNADIKSSFRSHLMQVYDISWAKFGKLTAIANKYALLIVTWLKYEYPENWKTIFSEFLQLSFKFSTNEEKIIKLNMFLNILITFDDEFIKYRHTFDAFLDTRSTLIKDNLRLDTQLIEIITFINNILESSNALPTKITINALKVLGQLIDWNSLDLFNESITKVQILFNTNDFIKPSLEVYSALTNKGQLLKEKLQLLNTLSIPSLISFCLNNKKILFEHECLYVISDMIQNLGIYFTESIQIKSEIENDLFHSALEYLTFLIDASSRIIEISKNERNTGTLQIDFLSQFINLLKHQQTNLTDYFIKSLTQIYECIQAAIIIPLNINITLDVDYRKDEDFKSYRKEFLNLFFNLFKLVNFQKIINDNLSNVFASMKNNTIKTLNHIELCLILFNTLDTSDINITLFKAFIEIDFLSYNSETILLLYYETIVKLLPLYLNNPSHLLYISNLFISDKGILHSNIKIAGKITNLMLKFIEKTRNYLDTDTCMRLILSLKDIIDNLTTNINLVVLSEFSSIYHLYGILINSSKLTNENTRTECLVSIFNKFLTFCNEFSNDKFNIITKAILNFFKSFNSEIKTSKELFYSFFKSFYEQIFYNAEKNSNNIINMINLFQKIIIVLGKNSLGFIDLFLSSDFIQNPNEEIFENTLKLMVSLTSMLKKDSKDIISKHFTSFYCIISKLNLPSENIAETDKVTLRLFDVFIQLVYNVSFDIVEVLYENMDYSSMNLVDYLINICIKCIDATTKRKSLKCLKGIITYLVKFNEINNQSLKILELTWYLANSINFKDVNELNVSELT